MVDDTNLMWGNKRSPKSELEGIIGSITTEASIMKMSMGIIVVHYGDV